MKILTLIFTFTLIFQLKAQANTNISHAIAMHGEPKYSKNFENVENRKFWIFKNFEIVF